MLTHSSRNADELSKLQRIAAGDTRAVEECISNFGKAVWSLALRLSPTYADAEDATQDIFLDLWKSAPRFDPTKALRLHQQALLNRR